MISYKPIDCNLNCQYCYEKKIRDNGDYAKPDIKAVVKTLRTKIKTDFRSFSFHGGEPLLTPIKDIEKILKILKKENDCRFKNKISINIQTNGVLLTDKHIKLFKKYGVHMGFSIDGHLGFMNRFRFGDKAEKYTTLVFDNMMKSQKAGLNISVIAIMNSENCSHAVDFVKYLFEKCKINGMRFNPVITRENGQDFLGKDIIKTYRKLIALMGKTGYEIRPIRDVFGMLKSGNGVCVFTECDSFATTAEQTILGDGTFSNCLKNSSTEGLTVRCDEKNNARYINLPKISKDNGGCKGCEWWDYCTGGCPGEGINNDWRNRSSLCEIYSFLFKEASRMLKVQGVKFWKKDNSCNNKSGHIDKHGDVKHGDHTDFNRGNK